MDSCKNGTSESLNSANHIRHAIMKLASYRFYFRDCQDGFINNFLDLLATEKKLYPLGSGKYKSPPTSLIGLGSHNNTKTATGGEWYRAVKQFQLGQISFTDLASSLHFRGKRQHILLKKLLASSKRDMIKNSNVCLDFHEWVWQDNMSTGNSWENIDNWRFKKFDFSTSLASYTTNEDILWKHIWNASKDFITIPLDNSFSNSHAPPSGMHRRNGTDWSPLTLKIINSNSPIIIATDGGKQQDTSVAHTTASVVLGILDIRDDETVLSGEWINRDFIPLVIRGIKLPLTIGTEIATANFGEAIAACMQD